jgi:DNA-binding response OmpR family regulator
MTKPFSPETILAEVKALLDGRPGGARAADPDVR